MDEPLRSEMLARYLAGAASPEEEARVRMWLESDPDARATLEGLPPLGEADRRRRDPEAALQRLRARERQPARADRPAVRPMRKVVQWSVRLAAVLLLVFGARWALREVVRDGAGTEAPAGRVYATAPGERTSFELPDGTTVTLNVASRLVAEPFGERRVVRLEGEAFFDVAPDAARPFVVEAGGGVVTVLGTAFGVEAYAGDAASSVVVVEGRVAFRPAAVDGAEGAVLTPGERGRLASEASDVSVERVDTNAYLAWRDGRLVFQGTPLAEVARDLGRWYDAAVVLAEPTLGERRLDAAFTGEPLDQAARTIALALDLEAEVVGRRVVFSRPR